MNRTMPKNTKAADDRKYWKFIDATAQKVASWPDWMRGEKSADHPAEKRETNGLRKSDSEAKEK